MSTIVVSDSSELVRALTVAKGGETVALQPGSYSNLIIKNLSFAEGVTITSADPANRATITDLLMVRAKGLNFSDLEFATSSKGTYGFNIQQSSDLHFDRVYVHGILDGDPRNDAGGFSFLNVQNISVTNSEFEELRQGVGVGTGSNIEITGNHLHNLMKTGLVFAGVQDVRIVGNTIAGIKPVPEQHPDAIQFFTTGTSEASRNILISDNLILRADGDATQGIFFRDQVGNLHYENVTITHNLIVGTGYGGIYAEGMNGLVVSDNELVSAPGKENRTFFLIQNSENVVATNNKGVSIDFDNVSNLTQKGNKLVGAVVDDGDAAIRGWLSSHPDAVELLSPYVTSVVEPPPIPEPAQFAFSWFSYSPDWASGWVLA